MPEDYDDDDGITIWDDNEPVVCMTHMRYLPCRRCYEDMSGVGTHSALPSDIEKVRAYQNSGGH